MGENTLAVRRFRRLSLGLVWALALLGIGSVPVEATVPAAPNAYLSFNEYSATASSQPFEIISGPDGNLWYTGPNTDTVDVVNPGDGTILHSYLVGSGAPSCAPTGITIGPDRNIWVACFNGNKVIRIIPSTGAQKSYPLPSTPAIVTAKCSCPLFMTPGPDGFLWFIENGPGYVTKFNVSTGAIHRFPLPAGIGADPRGIALGSDGDFWITEASINRIGRMTPAGVLTTFAVPTANAAPFGITAGPDGDLYYTEANDGKIGRLTTAGVTTNEFVVPTANSGLRMIGVGPDGNLWFPEFSTAKIGSMTPTGVFQDVAVPTASSEPFDVATGPDGNLWFTELGSNKIGKVGARHATLYLDNTGIGFGDVNVGATTATQHDVLTNFGAESLSAFTPTLEGGGAGGPSGNFNLSAQTCDAGAIAASGSCSTDTGFVASSVQPGLATSQIDYTTDLGTATEQRLSVPLSSLVNVPACKSVSVAPSMTSPQNVGVTFNLVATAAGCPNLNPKFRFYLRNPAGVWSIVRDFTTSDTFSWNTSTYKAGTYLIGVWAKDAQSNKSYDAYAFGTFTLQFPYCTFTSLASDVASPQVPSTVVHFTATTSPACSTPLHQWWVRNAAGVWKIVVPYAVGTTFAWDTTGLPNGTYQIGVWAKQTGSTKSYDAFAFVTYTLATVSGTTHCQAVNVAASPGSPSDVGTPVTFTATALGCDTPQYRWWIRDTSANWTIVQDYPGTNQYPWSTASRPAGTYLVGVWVRQSGSASAYEAYSFITFTLQVPAASAPCTSVGISPDMTSPQDPGATVTFTGAALGCATPNYQFFVAPPPSGIFGIVQPFSGTDTFAWNTTGLAPGPYQIGVWAKNVGSTKSYEAFAFITFQLSSPVACSTLVVFPTAHGWTTNNILSQSPQPAGITVNWSALATGCATPTYEFYVLAPGSSTLKLLQAYSATQIAAWNTAGLPRGTYEIVVVARATGSASSGEVAAASTYELV